MYALRIIAMLWLAIAVPSVALESIPAAASPTASTTIVVDYDGAQCARADYASQARKETSLLAHDQIPDLDPGVGPRQRR